MNIEANKHYKTRGGEKVRIYATDCSGIYSVHGAILSTDGWWVSGWLDNGRKSYRAQDDIDIVSEWEEPPPKMLAYISINGDVRMYQQNYAFLEAHLLKRAPWLDEK